jgi:hypothetical protein
MHPAIVVCSLSVVVAGGSWEFAVDYPERVSKKYLLARVKHQ